MSIFISILKWLWSLVTAGFQIGNKSTTSIKNDYSVKQQTIGKGDIITNVENHYHFNTPTSKDTEVLAHNSASSSQTALLSKQALTIFKRLIESGDQGFAVSKIDCVNVDQIGTTGNVIFDDIDLDSVEDDLTALVNQGFLKQPLTNNVGCVYYLSSAGKQYGKTLFQGDSHSMPDPITENKGNTSI